MELETSRYDRLPDFVKKYCYETRDVIMSRVSPQRFLDDIKNFEVREDDIFIITYPKSGTTWMQQIVTLLLAGGDVENVSKTHLIKRVPFLEMSQHHDIRLADTDTGLYEIANKMASPRVMKTHLVPILLPTQLQEKKPKIIYVVRNPKDTAVSFFHFCNFSTKSLPAYPSWEQFFTDFCSELTPRGSWFDHVLYWSQRRHESNVFFITYEEMVQDLRGSIARVCGFLGLTLGDDVIDLVTKHCTFNAMKNDPTANPDSLNRFEGGVKQMKTFMRKGEIGDWKNYFTVAQDEAFNELYRKKMSGSGLEFTYEL